MSYLDLYMSEASSSILDNTGVISVKDPGPLLVEPGLLELESDVQAALVVVRARAKEIELITEAQTEIQLAIDEPSDTTYRIAYNRVNQLAERDVVSSPSDLVGSLEDLGGSVGKYTMKNTLSVLGKGIATAVKMLLEGILKALKFVFGFFGLVRRVIKARMLDSRRNYNILVDALKAGKVTPGRYVDDVLSNTLLPHSEYTTTNKVITAESVVGGLTIAADVTGYIGRYGLVRLVGYTSNLLSVINSDGAPRVSIYQNNERTSLEKAEPFDTSLPEEGKFNDFSVVNNNVKSIIDIGVGGLVSVYKVRDELYRKQISNSSDVVLTQYYKSIAASFSLTLENEVSGRKAKLAVIDNLDDANKVYRAAQSLSAAIEGLYFDKEFERLSDFVAMINNSGDLVRRTDNQIDLAALSAAMRINESSIEYLSILMRSLVTVVNATSEYMNQSAKA